MIESLVAILPPLAVAFLLAGLCFRGTRSPHAQMLLNASLAVGLALGLSSCTYLVWLLVEGPWRSGLILGELSFFVVAGGLLFFLWGRPIIATPQSPAPRPKRGGLLLRTGLLTAAVVALATGVTRFTYLSLAQPHGEVDAVTIWNLRARFLAEGNEHWRESLTNLLASHNQDYPLLLPASIARWWTYLGDNPAAVPALVAMLFTLATAGLVVSALGLLRSIGQGLLAGIVLLGTPFFIKHGASQYADIPLGFFILATLVAFSLLEEDPDQTRPLVIAGLAAGCAAWTKNEGLLFVVVIVLVRLLVVVPARGWTACADEMRTFAAGLLPVLLLVGFFKTFVAPGLSPILAQQGTAITWDRITDLNRYAGAAQAFVKKAVRFGHPGIVVLLGYWMLVSRHEGATERLGFRTSAGAVGFMLAGYFMIIIITPHGLEYQIATALDRLWIQLWPSAVFLFFLFVRTPEEAMGLPDVPAGKRP